MKKLEEFDPSQLDLNPFVQALRIPCTKKLSGHMGYEDGKAAAPETYAVERTPHVRIFYTKEMKERLYKLTPKALRLFHYILLNLDPNKDYIQLNPQHFMKQCEVKSINTFIDARKELIRYAIISGSCFKSVYFINVSIFFPGNRISNFKDKIYFPYPNEA